MEQGKSDWNKVALTIVILLILLVPVSCQREGKETEAREAVTIGVILPLTGPGARLGEWALQGISIAQEEINAQGGIDGRKVHLVIEDDQCQGQNAVNAFTKLTTVNKAKYVIGPLCNTASIPIAPLAENNEVVIVTLGVSTQAIREAGDYSFTILPGIQLQTKKLAEYLHDRLYISKVSVLHVFDEYGEENQKTFENYFENLGGVIVSKEAFGKTDTDFRTQLAKIKEDEAEIILIIGYTPNYIDILKQIHENDINKPVVAVSNIQDPNILTALGDIADGVQYTYPAMADSEASKRFVLNYQQKTNQNVTLASLPMYVGAGYDALYILSGQVKRCGEDTACVQDGIIRIRNYHGINGELDFDLQGNVVSDIEIKRIKNNKFVSTSEE